MSDFIIPVDLNGFIDSGELTKETNIKLNKIIRKVIRESQLKSKRSECYFCRKGCKGFCNSHTVPAFCLKNIAKNGEVLSNNSILGLPGIKETKGINEAATFHIICRECDGKLFQEYENENNYSQMPTIKMLAEIAMKNCLRTIDKRELETQLYDLLEDQFDFPSQITIERKNVIKLDLKEEVVFFKKAKQTYNKPFENDYRIGLYITLPYRVPIAFQGEIALCCDLEGGIINNLYNRNEKYWVRNINVAVFPLKEKSIILVFVEKDNKRYSNFFKQIASQ